MSKQYTKTEEKVSSDVLRETTAAIAKQLNEPAVERLRWLVAYLGPKVALEVMDDTLKIEEQGGMLVQDGSRRRTPGGIFFSLVKKGVNKEDRRKLFPYTPSNQGKLWPKRRNGSANYSNNNGSSRPRQPIRSKYQLEMKALLKGQEFGVADNMSVKLIGRPGQVVQKDSFVMMMMQLSPELPSMSKDLPPMPQSKLRLLVYITKKQWNQVASSLERPENSLNINGILTYDEELRRMVVFTRAVTVKVGQPSLTEEQKSVPESKDDAQDDAQDDVVSGPVEFSEAEDLQDAQEAGSESLETETSDEEDAPSKLMSLEEEFAEDEPQETVQSDLEWE